MKHIHNSHYDFATYDKGLKAMANLADGEIVGSFDINFDVLKLFCDNLIREEKVDQLLLCHEQYSLLYPRSRGLILANYLQIQQNLGYARQTGELARLYVEASNKLLEIGINYYGLPPLFESYWALSRVGELVEQTAYVHFMRELKKQPQKPVMCITQRLKTKTKTQIANQAFLPYLHDNFEIVSDPKEALHFLQRIDLAPYPTFLYKYSDRQYGENGSFYGSVYHELVEKKISTSAFQLKDVTIEPAKRFLNSFGITESDEFVVLHLRETGFIDSRFSEIRNVNPLAYVKAINWLVSQGLKVVRIGHPNMTLIPIEKGFIDLTRVARPPEVDIYLCARAQFYYGSDSGPHSFAKTFGTKILSTNSLVQSYGRPNWLLQLRPIFDLTKQRNLFVSEIENLGLSSIESLEPYSRLNLQPRLCSSDENLRSVQDMMDFIQDGKICRANAEMKVRTGRQDLLSTYTSDSLYFFDILR